MSSRISKEEALSLISNSSKFTHSIRAGKVMFALAQYFNEDEEEWELVGLLHDLDFDLTTNNREKHGVIAAEMLKDRLSERALYAIKAHDHRTGFKPNDLLSKILRSADALVVFIDMAKEEGIPLELKSLERRLNSDFPRRPWIKQLVCDCTTLGITIEKFLKIGLKVENEFEMSRE